VTATSPLSLGLGLASAAAVIAAGRALAPRPRRLPARSTTSETRASGTPSRERGTRVTIAAVADLTDELVVAVAAGLTAPLAIAALALPERGRLGELLTEVERRRRAGARFTASLTPLVDLGEVIAPLAHALLDHDRDGTPLLPALERAATELRDQRRHRAEARARRVPVLLLFPLVLCVLPAFVLLAVVPLLAGATASLRL
jgi:tight adherence protein C